MLLPDMPEQEKIVKKLDALQESISNRFDTTAFKKQYNELYQQYTKQVASKRFSIA